MQVTKCDRCGAIYKPLELYQVTILKMTDKKETLGSETKERILNCSRLVMTNKNTDFDLCEKCTEEILASFKGE